MLGPVFGIEYSIQTLIKSYLVILVLAVGLVSVGLIIGASRFSCRYDLSVLLQFSTSMVLIGTKAFNRMKI